MTTVVATILKVGARGSGGDFITLETLQAALAKGPVEGVKRLWIEGDELKAEMDIVEDVPDIFRKHRA